MDDTFCAYEGTLNKALTMIMSMSEPEKLEAITIWNNFTTQIREKVTRDENLIVQAQQQNQSETQGYETLVDVSLSLTNSNATLDSKKTSQPIDTPMGILQDIDILDNLGEHIDAFNSNDDLLLRMQHNRLDEIEQILADKTTEELISSSRTRSDETQSSQLVSSIEVPNESYQGIPSNSQSIVNDNSNQSTLHLSSQSCFLPTLRSALLSTNQIDDLHQDSTRPMPHANNCTSSNIDDQSLIESSTGENSYPSDNLAENSPIDQCLHYSGTEHSDHSRNLANLLLEQEIINSRANQNSSLVTTCHSLIEDSSAPLAVTSSQTNSCLNEESHETDPLQQVPTHLSSIENTGEFQLNGDTGVNHESGRPVGNEPSLAQQTTLTDLSQSSLIVSARQSNYTDFSQQITDAPSNIDTSTKSDKILYNCHICGKSGISSEGNLKRHLAGHSEVKPHQCDQCEAAFKEKRSLEAHLRRHADKILYDCHICGKPGISSKGNFKRHLASHSGVKPHQCDHCKAAFTEKKSLQIHLRKHTGERPYNCHICHKQFRQKEVLESHMVLHNGVKGFPCPHQNCGKSFKQRSQLATHLNRHVGKKTIECPKCDMKFYLKGDLDRHMTRHTGELRFRCNQCPRAFTRLQSLNEHLNRHSGKKPFICEHCDKGFPDLSAYKKVTYPTMLI